MADVDIEELRQRVGAAAQMPPASGDAEFDELAHGSLIAAFNRIAPREHALPTEGLIALEVSAHAGARLPAHEHGRLEEAVARAIAFVGAAIAHPDADVVRLGAETRRQSIVYARPTPTGAIAFLSDRSSALPGLSGETVAEQAMARLARILPANASDESAADRLLSLRQPERRAVIEVAKAARPLSGLSLLLLGQEETVQSTVTSSQADDIRDLLRDEETVVTPMRPVFGRLDGMRFSRQMYFLQIEGGPDRQGVIDIDLVRKAKQLLDQRVEATLERVVTKRADGSSGRPAYRLVGVRAAPEAGLF